MTAEEVKAFVECEIAGQWSVTNDHLCDLRKCVIEPVKRSYETRVGIIELWLVLEEDPDECDGYKIVFDEEKHVFGLACPGISGRDFFLGPYGSFLTTFAAM
jgi:hypothetical protein